MITPMRRFSFLFRYDPEPTQLFVGGWILMFGLMMLYNGFMQPQFASGLLVFKVAHGVVPFYIPGVAAMLIGTSLMSALLVSCAHRSCTPHACLRMSIRANYAACLLLMWIISAYFKYGASPITVYSYLWVLCFSLWLIFRLQYRLVSEINEGKD